MRARIGYDVNSVFGVNPLYLLFRAPRRPPLISFSSSRYADARLERLRFPRPRLVLPSSRSCTACTRHRHIYVRARVPSWASRRQEEAVRAMVGRRQQ
jgi:hypothetical protein